MNSAEKGKDLWLSFLKTKKESIKNIKNNVPDNSDKIRATDYNNYLKLMETKGWIGSFENYLLRKKLIQTNLSRIQ